MSEDDVTAADLPEYLSGCVPLIKYFRTHTKKPPLSRLKAGRSDAPRFTNGAPRCPLGLLPGASGGTPTNLYGFDPSERIAMTEAGIDENMMSRLWTWWDGQEGREAAIKAMDVLWGGKTRLPPKKKVATKATKVVKKKAATKKKKPAGTVEFHTHAPKKKAAKKLTKK